MTTYPKGETGPWSPPKVPAKIPRRSQLTLDADCRHARRGHIARQHLCVRPQQMAQVVTAKTQERGLIASHRPERMGSSPRAGGAPTGMGLRSRPPSLGWRQQVWFLVSQPSQLQCNWRGKRRSPRVTLAVDTGGALGSAAPACGHPDPVEIMRRCAGRVAGRVGRSCSRTHRVTKGADGAGTGTPPRITGPPREAQRADNLGPA